MADTWRSILLQAHSIDYLEVIHHVPTFSSTAPPYCFNCQAVTAVTQAVTTFSSSLFQLSSYHTSCHYILLHSVPLRVSEDDDDDNGDEGDEDDDCFLLRVSEDRLNDDDGDGDDDDDEDVSEDRLHDDDGDDDDDEDVPEDRLHDDDGDDDDDDDVSEDRLHDEAPRVPGEALALVLPAPALGQSLRRDAPGRVSILLPPIQVFTTFRTARLFCKSVRFFYILHAK